MVTNRDSLERTKSSMTEKRAYSDVPNDDYDDTRDEKPWQRVSSVYMLIVIGFYILLGYCTHLNENAMPAVVNEKDIPLNNTNTFSEEAARKYLDAILGDQPRVAGTRYHLKKTIDLKNLLDDVSSKANVPMRIDWQLASGDYWIEFSRPYVNLYQNVSNVVAVLEGESGFNPDGSTRESLLVNCHYDSVPFAIGASDDGLFCAVMVEIVARLSRRKKKFKHNIVFIFNGAEENLLQGSYGFLSHPWFKGVTKVVNLDSAGTNGKAQVFQVTDSRMLTAYSNTNRPSAQSIGQFVFSTGFIPSDTDFRIWRHFGGIQGLDIAFTHWGHVYHTRNDRTEYIKPGVIQCAGDMLLNLVMQLADNEDLNTKEAPSSEVVFFDYANQFLVIYSDTTAIFVDIIVCLLAALSILYYLWLVGLRKSSIQELIWVMCGRILCVTLGFIVVASCTLLMVATTIQMRYLSQPWIIVPLYWIPYLLTSTTTGQLFDSWRTTKTGLNRSLRVAQAAAATRLLETIGLVVLVLVPGTTSVRYALSVPLALTSCASVIRLTAIKYTRLTGWQQLILEVFMSVPSVVFQYVLALRLTALLVPITGRLQDYNPDYVIAAVSCVLCLAAAAPASGVELLFSRKRWWAGAGGLAAVCLVIMFIPFSPYQDEGVAVQRHHWFHTEIVSYDRNGSIFDRTSGIFITKWDVNNIDDARTALGNSGLKIKPSLAEDCEKYPYCNMPLYRPRLGKYIKDGLFVLMEPPTPFEHTLQMTNRTCNGHICELYFILNSTSHNTLLFLPHVNVTLNKWSFESPVKYSKLHQGRPLYLIMQSSSTYSDPLKALEFNLTFIVPPAQQSQAIVWISHEAHKIQSPEEQTQTFIRLIDSMPKYFDIAPKLTFKSNYEF